MTLTRKFGWLLASFRGRISRFSFWTATVLLWCTFAVLFVFIEAALGRMATLILYLPLIWFQIALAVKRTHDRGRSAWWLLIAVIPILGPLWLLIELGFRVGTAGENQYGADPLEGADYLTVA